MTTQSHTARYIAAIVCFPLLLLAVNDSWAFLGRADWIDPYLYTGYFLDLKQHLNVFPERYYGTRLPWILLGAAVHAVATPEVASYVLRLILFYAATLSLFAIVRMLFDNNVAATMAAFSLGAHTYFLWAIGWDYVDGTGVALILVTTACLTAAAIGRRWRLYLVCAGIAGMSMVFSYIMLILVVPFQIGAYVILNRLHRRNRLTVSALAAGLGACAAFAAFGAANWMLNGRFLFFLPQLDVAMTVSTDRGRWKLPNYDWVANASWLLVPGIALAVGTVLTTAVLYRRLKEGVTSDAQWHALTSAVALAGLAATFLLMELAGFWLLQISYYAVYLAPYAFICIGSAIALATSANTSGAKGALFISVAAASQIVPFVVASFRPSMACAPSCQLAGQLGWMALTVALLLAGAAVWRNAWLTLPALVVLGVLNISGADQRVFAFPRSSIEHARALMVPDAVAALRPFNGDGNLRFWSDFHDPLGGVFRAVASTDLWAFRLISEDFPGRTLPSQVELGLGDTIVILTSQDDALQRATAGVSALGLAPELLGHRYVSRGNEGFHLTFIQLAPPHVEGVSELDLSALRSVPGARVKANGDVTIRTTAASWAYAVHMPIPQALRDGFGDCSALFTMHAQVTRGTVGVGVENAAGTDFVARKPVMPSSNAVDVRLIVPRLSAAGNIVIQTWDAPTEGVIDVNSIRLIRHGCSAER